MSPKELKKLAAACRAAGILTFKNSEVEFTLSDEPPVKITKGKPMPVDASAVEEFVSDSFDSLTEEEKLFYSSPVEPGSDS